VLFAVHWTDKSCSLTVEAIFHPWGQWGGEELVVVVVVVVTTSPSGAAYMGGQMSRRDEEFHQTLVVLEHICDVNRITEVTLAF